MATVFVMYVASLSRMKSRSQPWASRRDGALPMNTTASRAGWMSLHSAVHLSESGVQSESTDGTMSGVSSRIRLRSSVILALITSAPPGKMPTVAYLIPKSLSNRK